MSKSTDIQKQFLIAPETVTEVIGHTDTMRVIETAWNTGIPAILVGHSGTAKTTMLEYMHATHNKPYRSVSCYGAMEADNLIGKWIVQDGSMVYKLGILPFAMKHGISIGLQEINYVLPEVLVLLHEFFDERRITLMDLDPDHPDFVIEAHPDFHLFGTMNPPEFYPGARDLSPALLRRSMVMNVDVIAPELEAQVIVNLSGASEEEARYLSQAGQSIRMAFIQGGTSTWIGTADLVMWAKVALQMNHDFVKSAIPTIINKGNGPEDKIFLSDQVRMYFISKEVDNLDF